MALKELQAINATKHLFDICKINGDRDKNYEQHIHIQFKINFIYDLTFSKKIIDKINNIKIEPQNLAICKITKIDDFLFYIFCVKNELIIIEKNYFKFLQPFFDKIHCIISNSKNQIKNQTNFYLFQNKQKTYGDDLFHIEVQNDEDFQPEIQNFLTQISFDSKSLNQDILKLLEKVVIAYIIKRSYILTRQNRCKYTEQLFLKKTPKVYKTNEFIILKNITESVKIGLNISDQQIYIIKNLTERERDCYEAINYQYSFITNYFGEIENSSSIVIEYVEGNILKYIKKGSQYKIDLSFDEKIKIIGQIMFSIEYIQSKGIIFRDLKYDNVIIDSKHDAILFDFDKSKFSSNLNDFEKSGDIGSSIFSAPEQYSGNNYSFKVDVYSLGVLIYFIINEKNITKNELLQKLPSKFQFLQKIYDDCLEESPEKRPNITHIFNDFLFKVQDSLKDGTINENNEKIENDLKKMINFRFKLFRDLLNNSKNIGFNIDISFLYFYFANVFLEGVYFKKDINISMEYFKKSSDLNNHFAQYSLGNIYYHGKYTIQNINKAIEYWSLSAQQNNLNALLSLGQVYIPVDINKAIGYLTRSADQNDIKSQCLLGYIYYEGKYCDVDIQKSIHYFTLAANQNNTDAQLFLGEIYNNGKYCKTDIKKSIYYLTLSADNNNVKSQLLLGLIYYEKLSVYDLKKSIHYLELAANQNNFEAQFQLGLIYYNNRYIESNLNKAIHYLVLSGENGYNSDAFLLLGLIYTDKNDIDKAIYYFNRSRNSISLFNLGCLYFDEQYKKLDIQRATHYFTLSANLGNREAQYNLGVIYTNYQPKNINEAIKYLTKSAEQNYQPACIMLGLIYSDRNNDLKIDYNRAINYFMKACDIDNNNSLPQYYLGYIYFIQNNIQKAIKYFKLSADNGNSKAQCYLGIIYLSDDYDYFDVKNGFKYLNLSANQRNAEALYNLFIFYSNDKYKSKNLKLAFDHLKAAADGNFVEAQLKLGFAFYESKFLPFNIKKSIEYLEKASQNNSEANFILGFIYYDGQHVTQDIDKAVKYYKQAMNLDHKKAKNNLGVLYKNGDFIPKSMNGAIEYFMEASRKNCLFSLYNLAKIYYFDENEKNIPKAIELLEKAAMQQLMPAKIFLFFIYSLDDVYKNNEKAYKYLYLINKQMNNDSFICNIVNYDAEEYLFFIQQYDLIYNPKGNSYSDFMKFFFPDYDSKNEQNFELNSIHPVDLNESFYDGYGIN